MQPKLRPELDELVTLLDRDGLGIEQRTDQEDQEHIAHVVRAFAQGGEVVTNFELRDCIEKLYRSGDGSEPQRYRFWGRDAHRNLTLFTNAGRNTYLNSIPHQPLGQAAIAVLGKKHAEKHAGLNISLLWNGASPSDSRSISSQIVYYASDDALERYVEAHFRMSGVSYSFAPKPGRL